MTKEMQIELAGKSNKQSVIVLTGAFLMCLFVASVSAIANHFQDVETQRVRNLVGQLESTLAELQERKSCVCPTESIDVMQDDICNLQKWQENHVAKDNFNINHFERRISEMACECKCKCCGDKVKAVK